MKISFAIIFFLQFSAFSQCDTSEAVDFPDVEAKFPGGVVEMKRFITENIFCPDFKPNECFYTTGTVHIEFIVCFDGQIQKIQLLRSTNSKYEPIVINLIEKMPNWIPAKVDDQPVTSRCRLPIVINLQ